MPYNNSIRGSLNNEKIIATSKYLKTVEIFNEDFELARRGCYCMLTNHNTDFIKDLYYDYNQEIIDVRRSINSDAKNRVGKEIIIRNY